MIPTGSCACGSSLPLAWAAHGEVWRYRGVTYCSRGCVMFRRESVVDYGRAEEPRRVRR